MPTDPNTLHLLNARLADGGLWTLSLRDGVIAARAPATGAATAGEASLDLAGLLVLPAPVDGHVHLDKTLWGGPWLPHEAGASVRERIECERRLRRDARPDVAERAEILLRRLMAAGTTALRTHADVDDDIGLAHVEMLLGLRERFAADVTVQIVAFPQSGVMTRPGVAVLLDAAVAAGADLVGGLDPRAIDGDASGQLDVVFAIAERRGVGIDIHLHDADAGGNEQLRDIAARTQAAGLAGRVTVSHAFSLGTPDRQDFARTADALAQAGVSILTSAPGAAPMPPVKPLLDAGVSVFAGSDNIRDTWSPLGSGDMLDRAMLVAWRQGFRRDDDLALAYDLCSRFAANAMGLPSRGLEVGDRADLIVLDADSLGDAVARRPPRKHVIRGGQVIPSR
ncbi:amidohydrolase [Reyranella sp. CPCC 100927]|uniref:amidohydrolase n=1 Tax=Reyranella sp. CPCC 100927 TaxID=2599616 RepID=UPI0011B4C5C4|nr:amidohydrolase [Reyranella sp. CPCC 100927]TWT11518.1 amidohydrolase family protein [Reyranella sp. CPCC 100927]